MSVPPLTLTCAICSAPFRAWRYRLKRGKVQVCSRACQAKLPRAGVPKAQKACPNCGAIIEGPPSVVANRKWCSKKCLGASRVRPVADRFWERVDKNGPIPERRPELGPCWIWRGKKGYGALFIKKLEDGTRITEPANRLAWSLHFGPIPKGLYVCHACNNQRCVNINHLYLATPALNVHDAIRDGLTLSPR